MERPKWVAVVTGILAILMGVGYLILVQLLDYRGGFEPAPLDSMGLLWRITLSGDPWGWGVALQSLPGSL